MSTELRVFRFAPAQLGPDRTAVLPGNWEAIGGEYEDGTLWIVAARELVPGPEKVGTPADGQRRRPRRAHEE